MPAFGFDSAVTSLGHFGTGLTNIFDVEKDNPCTLQIICDKITEILALVNLLQGITVNISGRVSKLECNDDDHWKLIYSAIRDMRRELLRGKTDWRRKDN